MTPPLEQKRKPQSIPQAAAKSVWPSWIGLGWLALAMSLLSVSATADLLPFLENDFAFKLQSSKHEKLMTALTEELKNQREKSAEFELISQERKALRWDKDVLQKLLRARGYYAAQIKSSLNEGKLLHIIEPGPQYRIKTLAVQFPDHVALPNTLPIAEGEPLAAEKVLDTKKALEKHIEDEACLFEVKLSYEAEVNHETAEAFLTYRLADSPNVKFSPPVFSGNRRIESDFLHNFLTFESGDCFKRRLIETSRLGLLQSNLIARVEIELADPKNESVEVRFDVTERAHRTWAIGIGWESDTGAAFTPGWEHRNLFEKGEKLEIDTLFSQDKQNLTGTLSLPHQWRKNQTLAFTLELQEETSDAFDETSGAFGVKLTRPMWRRWLGSIGSNLEFNRTLENSTGIEEDFALLSFPVTLDYIRTDDPLNPTRGWALGTRIEPFINLYQTGTRFNKTSAAASWYITGKDWWAKPTFAIRAALGSISAIELENVPPDHRFYVGGGSSVRGYAYQSVESLDEEGNPVGGLSFGETSIELRLRFSQSWGAAVFADGGYAYPGERPEFGQDFLWGAGIGLRYFTSFAPIRFDIAAPLDKRSVENGDALNDDSVQIYISLGQAF